MNEKIKEELERQFPKKDKARGRALVLHAIAQIEFNELQDAFDIALLEINKLRAKREYWENKFKKLEKKRK